MTTIKFRRDTSANWTSVNPIPAQGEPCYETDTGKLKIGNGSDNYVALPYVSDGGGSSGDLPIATATTLGGVKVGDNLSITEDGTLSASSEAKTVKTPSGRIKLDDGGLHNEDNSRSIINRNNDQKEVTVGNGYEPTIIDGSSIKLNSTNITDRDGNTFLSGDTINGVKFYRESATGNGNVAHRDYTSNRLELTVGACNLYDADNRRVFGSAYNPGINKTDWTFASQSDTVRIAKYAASTGYGLMLKVPTDGTSPTIGYTYYGTDESLYGKEQTFLRTEDVDNSTIKIVDGKLTASGGGSAPTNMVTTDTTQTISGSKTFTSNIVAKSAAKLQLNDVGNNKTINLSTTSSGYLNMECTGTSLPEFISMYDNSNNSLDIAPTYIRARTSGGTKYEYINSQNIDTTYMKWDSTDKKLKVDTAAVAHLAMPSNQSVDLTLGTSGTTYTAPADGYVAVFGALSTSSNAFQLLLNTVSSINSASFNNIGYPLSAYVPAKKNDTIKYEYRFDTESRVNWVKFIYAVGAVPTNT